MKCKFCGKEFKEKNHKNGIVKEYCGKKCRGYENMLNWLLKKKSNHQYVESLQHSFEMVQKIRNI